MAHSKFCNAAGLVLCAGIALIGVSGAARASASKKPASTTEAPSAEGAPQPMTQDKKAPSSAAKPDKNVFEREFLVAFADAAASSRRAEIFARHSLREVERVGSGELYLVEAPKGTDAKTLIKAVSLEPGVRYIEPNLRMSIMPVPGNNSADE